MKQFLTLCMATAMIGTAAAAPKVTLREAMQLKSEGKAQVVQGMTRQNGVKPLKSRHTSAFHKLQADKEARAKKAIAKAMPNGDAIYGNLVYSASGEMPTGYYEINGAEGTFLWDNDLASAGAAMSYDPETENLKGYYPDIFWGMLFGVYYFECDAETGEITVFEEQDMSEHNAYMQVCTLADDGYFYGFGGVDGVSGLVKAPKEDPFAYEFVAAVPSSCNGLAYNSSKGVLFGCGNDGNFYEFTLDGDATQISSVLEIMPDWAPYLGGMVYDIASNVYYWNAQGEVDTFIYTIDADTYAATLVGQCPDGEEYMSLVTTDFKVIPGQPNAATPGEATFYQNEMKGYVTFTLPTELKDGTPINGRVKYNALLDNDLYTTGSQAAGKEVTIPYNCAAPGMHTFSLVVFVDGVASKAASVRCWVGNDNPLNPTNVVLTSEKLSWDAVPTGKTGVHGGWVAPGEVTYNVYINGEEKYTGLKACECDPAFDPEEIVEAYKATVVAVCNGLESVNSTSNVCVTGAPYNVPVTFAPTADEFAVSTTYDPNNRGFQYNAGEQAVQCGYTPAGVPMDAWYFLPPVAIEDITKFYTFSVDACYRSTNYPNEAFEVVLCNEPTPNGVVGTIIDYTALESNAYTTYEGLIGGKYLRQPGTYYVALHCVSDPDQLGMKARNFKIADNNITLESPAEATYLSAEETAQGELSANVEFTFPTTTLAGQELAADAELTATVSSSVDEVEITGKPGVKVGNVKVMTAQGDNVISVVVTNAEGLNSPTATTDVYTGVTAPATPVITSATGSRDNMSITLNWDAVTEPADEDGYIVPADVEYVILEYIDMGWLGAYWSPIDVTTETSYTYTVPEGTAQQFMYVGLAAQNAAGNSGYVDYIADNIGTPYALPFNEAFDDPDYAMTTDPWITWSFDGEEKPSWSLYKMDDLYEGEEGYFLAAMGTAGAHGMLALPRFATFTNAETIRVTFGICAEFELPKLTILGQVFGSEDYIELGELTVEEGEGFKQAYVDLPAEMLNQFWAQVYIDAQFTTGDELLAINLINVDCPTGVASVAGEGIKIAGGKHITISGLQGQNVIVSTLDGKVAAKKANVSNNATFNVEKGVYVVKAGDKNAKVVVK